MVHGEDHRPVGQGIRRFTGGEGPQVDGIQQFHPPLHQILRQGCGGGEHRAVRPGCVQCQPLHHLPAGDGVPIQLRPRGVPVGQQQHRRHHAGGSCRQHQPEGGFFVGEHPPDAVLGILLPKGQGEDGGERRPPAQVEEGLGVPGGVLPAESADHRLVAGGLHVPAEQAVGHPQHGVKPVDRQGQPGQDLGAVVPPAQVGLLVEKDVGPVGHIQPCGEVDPGPEEAADEGGGDLVGLVHPWLHPHRLGHLPPQPPVGEGSPQQAGPAPGGPDPCDHGGPVGGGRGFLWGSVWNGCLLDWGLG